MKIELTLVGPDGRLSHRVVESADPAAATAGIESGLRVLRSRRVRGGAGGAPQRKRLLQFCEALEQILAGGLGLTEALQALASDEDRAAAAVADSLLRQLNLGLSPSRAFEATGMPWSPFLIALLGGGERIGRLPEAFSRFVAFERSMMAMRARMVSASMYPLVLLIISGLVLLFLMGFVVPKFAVALADIRAQLSPSSALLLAAGSWIGEHLPAIVMALFGGAVATAAALRSPGVKAFVRRGMTRLPVIRQVVHLSDRAQALRVCAALLGGGSTLSQAMRIASNSAGVGVAMTMHEAEARIARGERPSQALSGAGLLGAVGIQLVIAAERTGGLAACFERLAIADEEKLSRVLDRASAIYGPLLLLLIAAAVGGVVISLYWPLLQVFDSVQ